VLVAFGAVPLTEQVVAHMVPLAQAKSFGQAFVEPPPQAPALQVPPVVIIPALHEAAPQLPVG
jgi:hypothetical protein